MGTQSTAWVASSAEELLAGATRRTRLDPSDAKSGSRFERVVIDSEEEASELTILMHDVGRGLVAVGEQAELRWWETSALRSARWLR